MDSAAHMMFKKSATLIKTKAKGIPILKIFKYLKKQGHPAKKPGQLVESPDALGEKAVVNALQLL